MPVGLRDRRTWRRRGPPARTLVIGTDARYWHQRALSAPARVVDMSARYIPLAVSTTPSQCRQPAPVSTTPSQCRQPTPVSATPSQCRQRAPTPVPGECPSPASDCSSEGLCPPRAWGIPSEGGEHHGMPRMPSCPGGCPIFLLQWEERNERCPLASGDCLCPSPRQGNARTRQGWPSLCTFASRRPRERPHAPGLARRGRRREHPAEGTPARARAGPRSGFPQVVRHPWGYAHKNPDLQNTHRAQGSDPALVRGPVFPNSLPCVRH